MVQSELFPQSNLIFYIAFAGILALLEWLVIVICRRYNIGPEITTRSLHKKFTPTFGGSLWVIAAVVGICLFGNLRLASTWIFMLGTVFLGIVSFIDDYKPLPPVPRLICQTAVLALTFKHLCLPETFDIYLLVLICGVGIINAINFLDGITGMLALYGIVTTGSLIYTIHILCIPEICWLNSVLVLVLVAQIVFACFNLCDNIFAGDVGSITLGYIQICVTLTIILLTANASYLLFFAICFFDTGLTTMQRLFSGISILQPHKMNIYQLLTSEYKIPHIVVSIIYALLQLLINCLFFLIPVSQHWTYFIIVCLLLTIAYFVLRFSFPKNSGNFA